MKLSTLSTLLLALAPAGAAAAPAAVGDAARGAAVFRMHCAACHSAGAEGRPLTQLKPAPGALRDPSRLLRRSDADLFATIERGGKAIGLSTWMPAFGGALSTLDLWDLVALLRYGQPGIDELFPKAARYVAKVYEIDADGQKRLQPVIKELPANEAKVLVYTAFSGEAGEDGPVYLPYEPRQLDQLKPKQKLGYVSFVELSLGAATPTTVAMALDKDGALAAVRPLGLSKAEQERAGKLLAGYVGQGGKRGPYAALKPPKAPGKDAKPAAELNAELTRAYFRVLEGAVMFDKEERDRHWAD